MKMQPDMLTAPDTAHYLDQYSLKSDQLPGADLTWFDDLRKQNLAIFSKIGFPTQRDEDWKYTPLRPITSKQFKLVAHGDHTNDSEIINLPSLDSYQIVFVDGRLDREKSALALGSGEISVDSLSATLDRDPELVESYYGSVVKSNSHGFAALNGALNEDGVVIQLEQGKNIERPIELVFLSQTEMTISQPRNLIVASKGSKAKFIERYVSATNQHTLTNSMTEIIVGPEAEIDYYVIQTQTSLAYQVCGIWVNQAENSRFSCRTVTLGGGLVRNDLRVELNGQGAHCDMLGVYSLSGKQHVDNHTVMIHNAENCTSNELYKGVLDQRSRAVFHGRIKVEKGAQKTDAQQSNNTLILSRDAEIDTKPQLEIYADDVKCSHGATIGQLDDASLFYLRTRGLGESEARSLLTFAFVNEVLNQVAIEPLRVVLEKNLASQLIQENQKS